MNVAENIIKKNTNNINTEDVDIVPCNLSVLVKFYDENPYRKVEKTSTGLYVGIESTKKYKSKHKITYKHRDMGLRCVIKIAANKNHFVCGYLRKESSCLLIMPAAPPGLLHGKEWRGPRPHG